MFSSLIKGIVSAILDWWQKRSEQPKTIEDGQNSETVKRDWNEYVADQLRNHPNSGDRQSDNNS